MFPNAKTYKFVYSRVVNFVLLQPHHCKKNEVSKTISSVNEEITEEILNGKLQFLCSAYHELLKILPNCLAYSPPCFNNFTIIFRISHC